MLLKNNVREGEKGERGMCVKIAFETVFSHIFGPEPIINIHDIC